MVGRYQLSSHVLEDADEARYDAHYAGELQGLVVSLVILPILPPSPILWLASSRMLEG